MLREIKSRRKRKAVQVCVINEQQRIISVKNISKLCVQLCVSAAVAAAAVMLDDGG